MKPILWNDNWKFWPDGNAFALVWNVPPVAETVTLPHDAMRLEKPRTDSPNKGNTGWRDGGNYTYVKQLFVPEEEAGLRRLLKCEGVYCHALVYVNGQYAGGTPNGYSSFTVDLTDLLLPGQNNEIRVQARNAGMGNSRWYSGSGIYRDVYLLSSGDVYLEPESLRVSTESVDGGRAVLVISAEAVNAGTAPCRAELCLRAEGAAEERVPLFLRAGERLRVRRRVCLESPRLWSAEHPELYRLEARLTKGETLLDEDETRFGVRLLSLDAARGLRVNGESVKLRGACIHHDSGLLGAATWEDAHRRQIWLLKQAGFNAIRMSHHPAAPALLRVCDELGMYVMDEFSDMWTRAKTELDYALDFEKNWREDVARMVRKDYNHPSVVLYSVGNEIPEIGTDAGSVLCASLAGEFRRLDPTRFTTAGINGVFAAGDRMGEIVADLTAGLQAAGEDVNVNEFMSLMNKYEDQIVTHSVITQRLEMACAGLDVAGYNYMTARYEADTARYPNRVMVGSETYPPQIARNWEIIKRLPCLIGDFTWTGWDYIGEAGIGVPAYGEDARFGAAFPCQLAYTGDLDLTGFRRPTSYFRELVFGLRTAPYIAVQDPHHYGEKRSSNPWVMSDAVSTWDWKGFEGKGIVAEVYADADEAELFLNGASLGRKRVEGFKAEFETLYAPGELKALAYRGGEVCGSFTLRSPGAERRLTLEKDYEGEQLLYLAAQLCDENGVPVTSEDGEVRVEVEGAELMGFGSGDHSPKHNYTETVTDTWHGRAQIILKKTGAPIRVTLQAAGGLSAVWEA